MKKALITGITGQDGSYLAEFLLQKGYEVHGIIRRSSSFNTERIEHLYIEELLEDMHQKRKVFLHYGDMSDATNLIRLIKEVDPGVELSYKRNYCGLSRNGKVENYVLYKPRKNHIGFHFRLPRSSENDSIIEKLDFSILRFDRWGFYVIVVNKEDIENKQDIKNKEDIKNLNNYSNYLFKST
jgi:hypothetical protein